MNETYEVYIRVSIDETARDSLSSDSETFNKIVKDFVDIERARKFLVDRYGRMPRGRNKVYVDTPEGERVVGFTHSYWNKDISNADGKSRFQTDWVMVSSIVETPVLLSAYN